MNIKKSILSVIILFVLSNILTTVWYMLMDEANYVPFRRDEINYGGLMLNHILFVSGFVYLFPSYIKSKNTVLRAVQFGAVVASIMFIPTGLVVRSIWKVGFNGIFVFNAIAHAVIGVVLGIVARLIYNYKNDERVSK